MSSLANFYDQLDKKRKCLSTETFRKQKARDLASHDLVCLIYIKFRHGLSSTEPSSSPRNMSSSLLISPHYKLHLKPHPNPNLTIEKFRPFHFYTPFSPRTIAAISSSFKTNPHTLPLQSLRPYVISQSKPILLGWLCSAVSAFSLSQLVPRIGQFSSNLAHIELTATRNEGLLLGALLANKMVASYLQQAFLWEAALTAVSKLRVDVFRKVLEGDLVFFEGGDAVYAGDIAYRITAEASDVACILYCLLSVSFWQEIPL